MKSGIIAEILQNKKKRNNEKQIQRRFYYGEQTKKPRDIHLSLAENSEEFPLKMIAMTEINFNSIYFSKIEPLIQSFHQKRTLLSAQIHFILTQSFICTAEFCTRNIYF